MAFSSARGSQRGVKQGHHTSFGIFFLLSGLLSYFTIMSDGGDGNEDVNRITNGS